MKLTPQTIQFPSVPVKPIRFLLTLIIGIALSFFVMFIWYITQPIVITVIVKTQQMGQSLGSNNTYVNAGITLLTYIEYWWGPIFVISISVLWFFISTVRTDWEGKRV